MSLTVKHHAGLVDDMANVRGIDLEEAAMRGAVTFDEISDAVLSCTGCSNPEGCSKWLDDNAGGSETSPEYCRNDALFARLAAV